MHALHRPLLLVLAVLVSGCQLRLGTDVTLDEEGGGTFELVVALDEELRLLLEDAGVDLRRDLAATAEAAPDWEIEEPPVEDGFELRFRSSFADPEELDRLVEALHEGLDPQDGRILEALEVEVEEDGSLRFEGVAGLIPPETTGAVGTGIEVDGEDLRRLLEERGDEFARYDLRVTLPAEPVASDADVVEGRTLTWHLPIGEMRIVSATSAVPTDRTWMLAVAVALAAFVVAALAVVATRRRGHRRRRQRADRLTPSG